jgi:hypothetical protein
VENPRIVVRPVVHEIYQDSSEANRIGKRSSVTLNVVGVGPNLATGRPLGVGFFLDSDSQIMLEYRSTDVAGILATSLTLDSSGNWTTSRQKYSGSMSDFGIHFKQCAANSFYWRAGLDMHTVRFNVDEWGYSDTKFGTGQGRLKGQSLLASFCIGNQWQWESFTLGCDWVGLGKPVSENSNYESNSEFGIRKSRSSDKDFLEKLYISGDSLILLRFYLGASF